VKANVIFKQLRSLPLHGLFLVMAVLRLMKRDMMTENDKLRRGMDRKS
jgi:hypothetical protein